MGLLRKIDKDNWFIVPVVVLYIGFMVGYSGYQMNVAKDEAVVSQLEAVADQTLGTLSKLNPDSEGFDKLADKAIERVEAANAGVQIDYELVGPSVVVHAEGMGHKVMSIEGSDTNGLIVGSRDL